LLKIAASWRISAMRKTGMGLCRPVHSGALEKGTLKAFDEKWSRNFSSLEELPRSSASAIHASVSPKALFQFLADLL
jgi:hypothetical protein